jgi:cell division protein FtsQ
MRVSSVLTPRRPPGGFVDIAEKRPLERRQRVARARVRRGRARAAGRAVRVVAWAGLVAALAAAGALGARWLVTSPRFALARVEVQGNSRIAAEEIVAASGLRPGVNLFALNAGQAVAQVETLPLVRRAELVRHVPDRVVLVVEERRPFTLVHAGRLHWIDEYGVVVGRASRAVVPPVPVLSGLSPEELATASRAPSERVSRGLALIRTLIRSGSPLLGQVSEIDMSRSEGPVLYTVDGVEVRLGRDDWESRLPRLTGVLAQVRTAGEGVSGIDLRFRDQIVLRPAGR